MSICAHSKLIFASAAAIYAVYKINKFFTPPTINPKPKIHKTDFKIDTVYLYQFRRLKNCPNMSPFCMKIEIICRIYGIPYEVVIENAKLRSRSGTLPFIELNEEHISDSDLIEIRLRQHFKLPMLSLEEEAQATSLSRMVDNHLFHILMRYHCADDIFYYTFLDLLDFKSYVIPLILPFMKMIIGGKIYQNSTSAIGDFEPAELDELLHRDLRVVETILGNKKYLFGDHIAPVDATVFSQLAVVYYPFYTHISTVLENDFPKILQYCERIRKEIYPNDFTI
ncbi:CaDmium Responsive [Caenorhabditis elegans]|uniref:CaDmium Responsive n=1 Tax=Caenorhabditis elegans TaxID=6239 RepID=G5EBH4_CAEEL|nr:CaDmium Responsive [Caenorhabditis elegans]AAU43722.1 cadmium-inducible lysosomal protein CDR-7 [Caenorhabditis elegans]CAI79192.1 CaDmium Responsive [Caenorhabditis elegans]|eukprot:NP_001294724.1 CaDmium Responsive [Caenorhabditis elegans]